MEHELSRDERRARARVVCAGLGLALAATGATLWAVHPPRHRTSVDVEIEHEPARAPIVAMTTPEEVPFYAFQEMRAAGEPGMTLPETTASIPEGEMFDPGTREVAESALRADAIGGAGRRALRGLAAGRRRWRARRRGPGGGRGRSPSAARVLPEGVEVEGGGDDALVGAPELGDLVAARGRR